jgi:deoxyinosine 3'endonuclease (endonuclease V)
MSFSKDNKFVAVLVTDKDGTTKAMIYDWYSKNKVMARFDFPYIPGTEI